MFVYLKSIHMVIIQVRDMTYDKNDNKITNFSKQLQHHHSIQLNVGTLSSLQIMLGSNQILEIDLS